MRYSFYMGNSWTPRTSQLAGLKSRFNMKLIFKNCFLRKSLLFTKYNYFDLITYMILFQTCNLVVQLSLGVHSHILSLVELVPEGVITLEILILPVMQPMLLRAMILFLILQMHANYFQFLLMIPFHMK